LSGVIHSHRAKHSQQRIVWFDRRRPVEFALRARASARDLVIGGEPVLIGGDVITALDGVPIDDGDDLGRELKTLAVGATLKLTVTRGSERLDLECMLTERPLLPGDVPPHRTGTPSADGARLPTAAARGHRSRFEL
jgi:membrane-associated protease RseP (regulator of RpoE activity)